MSQNFLKAMKNRRSYYNISPESTISDEKIEEIIQEAILHTPTPFNIQTGRAVLLLGTHHQKLWEIIKETLKKIVPAENFSATEAKINGFQAGYGSVMFFEDMDGVAELQKQMPLYQENFPLWSHQTSGMLQHAIWVSLELEGLGGTLQHYNPLIDEAVAKEWDIPAQWKLISQMPFGKPTKDPDPKEFMPIELRYRSYK